MAKVRISRVVTRSGDDGTTGLVGNRRVSKDNPRINAYGTVDELNAALGLVVAWINEERCNLQQEQKATLLADLIHVQNLLFVVGGELATRYEDCWEGMPHITEINLEFLDGRAHEYNTCLPALKEFVLPGGPGVSAGLHLARTVCRRAERAVVHLAGYEQVSPLIIPFLNRLSDLLFVWSRWVCVQSGCSEQTWQR